jgi:hypothetical protein
MVPAGCIVHLHDAWFKERADYDHLWCKSVKVFAKIYLYGGFFSPHSFLSEGSKVGLQDNPAVFYASLQDLPTFYI